MRKQLLLGVALASAMAVNAQTVLIDDSFESYDDFAISDFGNWVTIDMDESPTYTGGGGIPWENAGAPQAFIIFNPAVAEVENAETGNEVRNFDPHTGDKYAASWAAVMPADGGTGPNDDWLVSPQITLGDSENELTFWVKSMSNSYGLEKYQVGIYTGTGIPGDSSEFTIISGGTNLTAPYPDWQEKTFPLDDYNGQTIRVGIHCVTENAYMFMVDDFKVTTAGTAGVKDQLSSQISVYPNPAANVINISNNNNILLSKAVLTDLNGRVVKSVQFEGVTEAQISISDMASGIYMMTVSSDKGSMIKKIVKN